MQITFWGVRGTCPRWAPSVSRFGGATSCVECTVGQERLVFDMGTGLFDFACNFKQMGSSSCRFFVSHFHIDHIQGWPFFMPAYCPDYRFDLYAAELEEGSLKQALQGLMQPPYFPVTMDMMHSQLTFHRIAGDSSFEISSGIKIRTLHLDHPGGSIGYRLDAGAASCCYITDHEHRDDAMRTRLTQFIHDCDLLIYDSTYDDDEFSCYCGWGHSTWQEAVRLGLEAGAKRVAIFHHAPDRTDEQLTAIDARARIMHPGAFVARQGQIVQLGE
ncbi:MAG: MBL fold metallo-hydrolase [Pseudomonadota bacterium]